MRRPFRFLSFAGDPLTVRLAAGAALLVVCPLALALYALSSHHTARLIESRRQAAELQNSILETALWHQMVTKDRTLIQGILAEIGARPEVRAAMILDHQGQIRFADDPSRVGSSIARTSPACEICHSKDPADRDRWVVLDEKPEPVLRSVRPIQNRAECYGCHDPSQRLNGILILDLSLAEVHAQIQEDAAWILISAALLALVLLLGLGLLVRQLVLRRLTRLRRAARAIASGDLGSRAKLKGNDVIARLGQDFNHMGASLSTLVTELRAQEAQLASVMNSLEDGLVVLDRDLQVVACNRSYCRMVGQHPEALRGRVCCQSSDSSLPCCLSGTECPTRRCLETGEVQRAVFHTPAASGGPGRVEEVYTSPVPDADGNVVQVVEVWRDITERVREEERLAEIERLASLGFLAAGFSHEMNTPLATILTCAEGALGQLKEDAGSPEALRPQLLECAEIIRSQVLRCRRITEQFLRFSRGIPPSVEPLDLRQVVESVVSLADTTARTAGVTVQVEESGPLPPVVANTEVVQHVTLNLLVNAIQSMERSGGQVTVRFAAGDEVRIQVQDTGKGVDPEARHALFEPFRSQKPNGTGLGLFLSRTFMRRFGGDVRLLDSVVGQGSCFEIVFQRSRDAEP